MSTIEADATIRTEGVADAEFEPISRSSFLLKGVLAAGAVYGLGSVTTVVQSAFAEGKGKGGDIDILNFALTLEYLEAKFYDEAVKNVKLSGNYKKLAEEIGSNEQDHVKALTGAIEDLGGKPVAEPKFTFPLEDEQSFLDLAVTLEDTGVSAYNGAAPMIESKDLLAVAGSIVQVEGRHAGALRFENGMELTVDAFDPTLDEAAVLEAVKPYIQA